MNTLQVIFDARIAGGGTYVITGTDNRGEFTFAKTEHEFGFYVSRPNGVENLPNGAFSINLLNVILNERHFQSGFYLGLWQDDNGNWSIDETEWYNREGDARVTGMINGQRAIWDIEKGEAITL